MASAASDMSPTLAKSALLVIDMQEHFNRVAGHLVPLLLPLIKLYHSKDLPVFFTQHGHLPDDRGTLVRKWGPPGKGAFLLTGSKVILFPGNIYTTVFRIHFALLRRLAAYAGSQ